MKKLLSSHSLSLPLSLFHSLLLLLLASLSFTSCTDEESDLGIDLIDSTTLYEGIVDTLYADNAWTEFDDSLQTSGTSFGIIGNYHDATFGSASASFYTQIALPSNANDIAFDSMVIDSVVLSFAKTQLFPDSTTTYHFHFEVKQLSEQLLSDTTYYAFDQLPVDENATFFNGIVPVTYYDTVVNLKLDSSINRVIRRSATAEDFLAETKGLRVRILNSSDEGLLTVDLTSTNTCLRAYYHYVYDNDTVSSAYTFLLGAGTAHFTHFSHNYAGTLFASGNPIPGTYRLYLEPLAGQRVRLSFDHDLKAFHTAHPWAVIHHAELLLPVAPEALAGDQPDQILTLGKSATNDNWFYIDDLINVYDLAGYDGTFHSDRGLYRIRVSQHLQGLLRLGLDPGLRIFLNSARHAAQRTILNGLSTSDRPRIVIVYSE
jgi:hypothetical protein